MGFALNQISHDLLAQDVRAEEYLLYLGRKETLKHVPDLIDLFLSAKDRGLIKKELKLKIAGGGSFSDLGRDAALARGSVVDVPYLSEENKQELIKNAIALCQPSRNESFSIVIMEAWKELVPVLVDARAEVTRYHVEQSNGGLFYASLEEFAAEVELLREDTLLRKQLASAGRAYIEKVYSWEAVLKRFDNLVEMMSHDH
jgi:glycosyltransferase involved in cell wall biosynthesis